jgi:hypothetical protein
MVQEKGVIILRSKEDRVKFIIENPDMSYEELAPIFGITKEGVRTFCKRGGLPNKRITTQSTRSEIPLSERIAKYIKATPKNLRQLSDYFNVAPKTIEAAIKELESKNIMVDGYSDGGFQMAKSIRPIDKVKRIDLSKHAEVEYPIGFIADTHLGSKYERMDVLHALYDRFKSAGVETVFLGGNQIEGESRFNKHDIYVHGFEGQIANFVKKFPQRKGIITRIVSGDDHEGWYVQREHINIGKVMEDRAREAGREDIEDLGYMERDVEFKQPGGKSVIRVIHAGGGSSYATSYTSQKYAESLQGGEKPDIVLVGHFHKFEWGYPREIHMIQGGTTCDQTPYMRKKKIQAHVGGCILWVVQNERGIFTSVKVQWFPFFDKKFFAYKW